ncbi:unnamed protein product [Alternaria burnsii]|nr:unnamed protein product [Alternaria burnsii]
MDHATGFPTNGHPVYPHAALVLASKLGHHDPQIVMSRGTAKQNANIRNMLLANASGADILLSVQTHQASRNAGIHQILDNLSELSTEELRQIIHANERLLSPVLKADVNLKRKMSEDPDEEPAPSPQSAERPRKTLKGKKRIQEKLVKDTSRVMPYGCPGYGGTCQEHKKRRWTSKTKFLDHFMTEHPEEYKSIDRCGVVDGFKCLECKKRNSSFGVDTGVVTSTHIRELAVHVWHDHMISRTTVVHVQRGEVGVKDEPKESFDIRYNESGGTGLGDQNQSSMTIEKDEIKPAKSSGTEHEQTCDVGPDASLCCDVGSDSNILGEFDFGTDANFMDFFDLNGYFSGPLSDV